jgi:outer membrane translocation and assembly module TamA
MRLPSAANARAFTLCLVACALGCATIPEGRYAIDGIDVVGANSLDPGDIIDKIATSDSPKFLGLFRGLATDYSIFDSSVLQRDLARIERYLRGRGFFEAHVRAGRALSVGRGHVRIEIVIDEGPAMRNGNLVIQGLDGFARDIVDVVRRAATEALPRGDRFDEDAYNKARTVIVRTLTDHGYAYAKGTSDARADMVSHTIEYTFVLTPGIPAAFGAVSFVGLDPDGAGPAPQEIQEAPLRRTLDIKQGSPYSTARLQTATQALLDLEVFSGVQIIPGTSDPTQRVVPLVVEVQPTQLRTLRVGGGVEFDATKTDVHALFGWEDHNLLGGLRDLSLDFKPGVALYPTNSQDFRLPRKFFPEERLSVQFRQPAFLEARTTGFVQPELNVYPLLVEAHPTITNNVVGYVEPKISVGLERRFGPFLFAKLAYNVQGENPFAYYVAPGETEASLPAVLLSFPQLITQLQFVDDPTRPHEGFAANLDLQAAGGPFGGTARDLRIQPDLDGYVPLARGVTFALTASLGLLFPFNYGDSIEHLSPTNLNPSNSDVQTVYFRGFFLGGPGSNRGYPLRGVAPHGDVQFLNPATAAIQVAQNCDPNLPTYKPADCTSPIGGFTMWAASAEVRFTIAGPLGGAVFCDTGDVAQQLGLSHLRLTYLHMSCGVGGRYDTPVGPIRLDVGYRLPWLQILGQPNETKAYASDPTLGVQPRLLGQPVALAFGIGEAF